MRRKLTTKYKISDRLEKKLDQLIECFIKINIDCERKLTNQLKL